jgi:hypothetical protein
LPRMQYVFIVYLCCWERRNDAFNYV